MRERFILALDALTESLAKGLASRKFIATVAAFVATVLGVDIEVVSPLIAYVLVEGAADIQSRRQ